MSDKHKQAAMELAKAKFDLHKCYGATQERTETPLEAMINAVENAEQRVLEVFNA